MAAGIGEGEDGIVARGEDVEVVDLCEGETVCFHGAGFGAGCRSGAWREGASGGGRRVYEVSVGVGIVVGKAGGGRCGPCSPDSGGISSTAAVAIEETCELVVSGDEGIGRQGAQRDGAWYWAQTDGARESTGQHE